MWVLVYYKRGGLKSHLPFSRHLSVSFVCFWWFRFRFICCNYSLFCFGRLFDILHFRSVGVGEINYVLLKTLNMLEFLRLTMPYSSCIMSNNERIFYVLRKGKQFCHTIISSFSNNSGNSHQRDNKN